MTKSATKIDMYQEVTNAMIELLETDLPQWKKGWKTRPVTNIFGGVNGSTGEFYKGVNRLILAKAMINSDYKYNVWMTYKQAQAKNLQVKKGAKSVRLAYYNVIEKENKEGDIETIPFLNSFCVFNISQMDGDISAITPDEDETLTPIAENETAKSIFANTDVKIEYGYNSACYKPYIDTICMPNASDFVNLDEQFATLGHELVHSTGAEKRLNRQYGKKFGDTAYAREELVAELGASFLCAEMGCLETTLTNHASYLKSWLQVLKADKRAIFKASADAQKAVNYILENWSQKKQPIAA